MSFLYFLEGIRNPVMNFLMSLITRFGEETFFLVMVLIIFWCVDKKKGFYIMFVGFFGMEINTVLKMTFRIPRPWVLDPNFTIVESARAAATGYSFPSGHTQIITGTMGCVARTTKNRKLCIGSILLILLVAFSRMYLGCHTPQDVSVSLIVGTILVLGIYKVLYAGENKKLKGAAVGSNYENRNFIIMFCAVFITAAIALFYVFHLDASVVDAANLKDAKETTALLFGLIPAMIIGWFADMKYVHFSTKASIKVQLRKAILGIVIAVGIKTGLKLLFAQIMPEDLAYLARGIRYFILPLFATVFWPMTFPKENAQK